MKIILRQITVNILVYGRTAGDAINNAIAAGPKAKLLKAQAEPINPENNQDTAKLFHDFVLETGQSIPGFEVDAAEPVDYDKLDDLLDAGDIDKERHAELSARLDNEEVIQPFSFPQIWMVALTLEDSTNWNQRRPVPTPPLGEGGGMADTTAALTGGGAAASSAPGTAPATGTQGGGATKGLSLHRDQPTSNDPNDRAPEIVQGIPPEAVQINDEPAAGADDGVPTPGGE